MAAKHRRGGTRKKTRQRRPPYFSGSPRQNKSRMVFYSAHGRCARCSASCCSTAPPARRLGTLLRTPPEHLLPVWIGPWQAAGPLVGQPAKLNIVKGRNERRLITKPFVSQHKKSWLFQTLTRKLGESVCLLWFFCGPVSACGRQRKIATGSGGRPARFLRLSLAAPKSDPSAAAPVSGSFLDSRSANLGREVRKT